MLKAKILRAWLGICFLAFTAAALYMIYDLVSCILDGSIKTVILDAFYALFCGGCAWAAFDFITHPKELENWNADSEEANRRFAGKSSWQIVRDLVLDVILISIVAIIFRWLEGDLESIGSCILFGVVTSLLANGIYALYYLYHRHRN